MTMEAFRIEKTVEKGGKLTVEGLPFREGDEVEVTVRPRKQAPKRDGLYPLRGTVIHYTDPFESVAEDDWEALK